MAQIVVNVDDKGYDDVRDTLCADWGYKENVPNPAYNPKEFLDAKGKEKNPEYDPKQVISNPQSKDDFIQARVLAFIKNSYSGAKGREAARVAKDAAVKGASAIKIS